MSFTPQPYKVRSMHVVDPASSQRTVRMLHEIDLRDGFGEVHLPHALARKYPRAVTPLRAY